MILLSSLFALGKIDFWNFFFIWACKENCGMEVFCGELNTFKEFWMRCSGKILKWGENWVFHQKFKANFSTKDDGLEFFQLSAAKFERKKIVLLQKFGRRQFLVIISNLT